jgi:anti-sigma regulatory factor (Ser/Thr protein kinase)
MTETLSFQADIAELTRVAEWVEGVADRLELPDQTRFALDLCLEEALANVIRYGFPDGIDADRTVRVGLDRAEDAVLVTVEDHGVAYDPLATAEPVLPTTLDEASIGGLGVHLMRQFTQQMAYQRQDETNRLILRIGTTEPAPDPAG